MCDPSSMKAFLPVLLAAVLLVEQASALVCFSCTNQESNLYCLKPTVCPHDTDYCMTTSTTAGIGNIVDFGYSLSKGCSSVCLPSINIGVATVSTKCCQSFLCNFSAAGGGPRASSLLLGLGLLLSLLSAVARLHP
ncbi:lymphocyte antigen 6E-like [Ctenodactylus gundi]